MTEPTIGLFVTCVVDQIMPEIGIATVRLLRRTGVQIAFPMAQTCCGQPFFNSGFIPEAIRLAKQTIEILEPFPTVVLPSGSCTTMIRVEYPHLLKSDQEWLQRAKALAEKTFELTEYLTKIGLSFPASDGVPPTVTYHDSCHMARHLGLRDEPRNLLTKSGCQIHEMSSSEQCCGFGGLFSVRMPEVSEAMTVEKLQQAADTQTAFLVTSDPGCLMQMKRFAGKNDNSKTPNSKKTDSQKPIHIAQLLEERTRVQPEE